MTTQGPENDPAHELYVPENYRLCEYEAEHGAEHLIYEWSGDKRLATHWPSRKFCEKKGWDHKLTVAAYHWKAIKGPPADKVVCVSWRTPVAHIWPAKRFSQVVAVFAVNLARRYSQYLGWITNERIQLVPPIDVSRTSHPNPRRVIHTHQLTKGFPLAIGSDGPENGVDASVENADDFD